MLDGQHTNTDEDDVKWALGYDYDPRQTPLLQPMNTDLESSVATLIPSMADESVIDRANRMLGLQSTPDVLYPQHIEDTDDFFLNHDPLSLYEEVSDLNYSTEKTERTFLLGIQINSYEGGVKIFRHYQCLWMGSCDHKYQSHEALQRHYADEHTEFIRLQPDPLRVVCPTCFTFYPEPDGICTDGDCPSPMMLFEYICGEFLGDPGNAASSSDAESVFLHMQSSNSSSQAAQNSLFQHWEDYQASMFKNENINSGSYSYNFRYQNQLRCCKESISDPEGLFTRSRSTNEGDTRGLPQLSKASEQTLALKRTRSARIFAQYLLAMRFGTHTEIVSPNLAYVKPEAQLQVDQLEELLSLYVKQYILIAHSALFQTILALLPVTAQACYSLSTVKSTVSWGN